MKAYVLLQEETYYQWKPNPDDFRSADRTGPCWFEAASADELLSLATDRFSKYFIVNSSHVQVIEGFEEYILIVLDVTSILNSQSTPGIVSTEMGTLQKETIGTGKFDLH